MKCNYPHPGFSSRLVSLFLAVFMLGSCGTIAVHNTRGNAFRKTLAAMDWGSDTCYVYGHKTPDADAACSSLAYAQLMRSLGYNCVAKLSSPSNNETRYISGVFDFKLPVVKSSVAPGTRLIVTDHEEYSQGVDGARQSRILQIIDHHMEDDMASADVAFIRRETVGATCTVVWELFQEAAVPVDDLTARILLAGLLSDTDNLAKSNTTRADSLAWQALTAQLNLSPERVAVIRKGMVDALTNYDGMSDYEIFISDYKDYDMSGTAVGIGCVEWIDYAHMDAFLDRMLAVMPEVMARKGRDRLFLMATRYAPSPDPASGKVVAEGTYILYCGEGARQMAELAAGQSLREGICYSGHRLGRKTDVVPLFTAFLGSR